MANTKIPSELSSTPSISDSGNATAISIDTSEIVSITQSHTASVTNASTMVAGTSLKINGNQSEGTDNLRVFALADGTGSYGIEVSNSGGTASYPLCLNPINRGNVAIGTLSPNQDGFDANATVLTIKSANNGEGVLELIGGGNSSGDQISVINFMSQSQANPAGQIKALRGSEDDEAGITFHNSGAQRMAINSDGNVTISKGLTVGTTVQPTSGELDGTGQSGTNVITIGDTTKSLPAILLRSSVTNGNWLADYTNTSGYLNSYNTDTNIATMSQK